ncbi:hypothetical protein [Desulfonema ishimotonii]|uniref:hypothetical protein n=1 Tax=Desulfonema ishimotonii TaxID=45657 RepID=UPI000F581AB0|nr:hypothetical protein [Desulfonema ishimotonii]
MGILFKYSYLAILLISATSAQATTVDVSKAGTDPGTPEYSDKIRDTDVWILERVDHLNEKWIRSLTSEFPGKPESAAPASPAITYHQAVIEQYYQAGFSPAELYRVMAKSISSLPIPPSTLLIFASGLIGILVVRKRIAP